MFQERVGNKSLGCQFRTIQITARHSVSANVELAPNARRNGLEMSIKNVGLSVRDRTPDGNRSGSGRDTRERRPDRRLRRAIKDSKPANRIQAIGPRVNRESASPPQRIFNRLSPAHFPIQSEIARNDGVACMTVVRLSRIKGRQLCRIDNSKKWARITRAPVVSGRKISSPAISNEMLVTESKVSTAVKPGSRHIVCKKLTTAR